MAKQKTKPTTEATTAESVGTMQDAIRAICSVTGCGVLYAEHLLGLMEPSMAQAIADAEASGNRALVPKILTTTQDNLKDDPSPVTDLHSSGESSDG